jgi:hypothetical protein
VIPQPGELWEFTQSERVAVGNRMATYLISGPALILGVHSNCDGHGDYFEILWGGKWQEIIDRPPWNYFGERIS